MDDTFFRCDGAIAEAVGTVRSAGINHCAVNSTINGTDFDMKYQNELGQAALMFLNHENMSVGTANVSGTNKIQRIKFSTRRTADSAGGAAGVAVDEVVVLINATGMKVAQTLLSVQSSQLSKIRHRQECLCYFFLRISVSVSTTRSTSALVMAGKSGRVRMARPMRSALGKLPAFQPSLRYIVKRWTGG